MFEHTVVDKGKKKKVNIFETKGTTLFHTFSWLYITEIIAYLFNLYVQ